MASTNPYTSFTITQPFLGAPLQFIPALGSNELEELIDNFVSGAASKKDKLSEVTLDFYNNASVDLNTGALTRSYQVYSWAGNVFEQSPTQSMSSGFSPIFTPSPGSSATFGDSGYGSISMTPPTRNRGARPAKKAKKDTPKAVEARLPGFQIMTKDGIDVTNSAGRGTKTKEQREHAHLMRIMKACDACKKKKIRCDPSHRRSHNDMSRTSTSTTHSSSSGHVAPSPPVSTPSLSRATTQASQSSLHSFSSSNQIDDFVLFPEDSTSWNPELETQDLGQFNFDLNDFDFNAGLPTNVDQSFDFSFDPQPSYVQTHTQFGQISKLTDQYGSEYWAEPQGYAPVTHTRPHPAGPTNDSGQLDPNWESSWLQADALISPTNTTFADNYWNDSHSQLQTSRNAASGDLIFASEPDWPLLESSIVASSSSPGDSSANSGASESSRSRKRRAVDEQESSNTAAGSLEPVGHRNASRNVADIERPDPSDLQGFEAGSAISYSPGSLSQGASPSPDGFTISQDIARLQNSAQLVSKSLRSIGRAPAEYTALGAELQQLEGVLTRLLTTQHDEMILTDVSLTLMETLSSQLQVIVSSANPQRRRNKLDGLRPAHAQQLQVLARRLARSLCATMTSVELQNTGSSPSTGNTQMLTSGRNLQLQVPSSESRGQDGLTVASGSSVQTGLSSSSRTPAGSAGRTSTSGSLSHMEPASSVLQHAAGLSASLDSYLDGMVSLTADGRDNVANAGLTVREEPRYAMILKTSSDPLSNTTAGSRSIEHSESPERELLVAEANLSRHSPLSSTWTHSEREAYREVLSSGQGLSRIELLAQEPTGGLATARSGRENIAIPSSSDVQRDNAHSNPSPTPSLTVSAYARAQHASHASEAQVDSRYIDTINNVKSEIQSVNGVQSNLLSTAGDVGVLSGGISSQLSFVAAVTIIGGLALASNVSSSGVSILAHLPYLLPILALSFLIPGQHRPSTALIAGVFLFASSSTISGISDLRSNCTEWIGNEPFSAIAKLFLVATLVSSELLSSLNLTFMAATAVNYLTGTQNACSPRHSSRVPRRQACEDGNGFASWLGMMDVLSPVVAV